MRQAGLAGAGSSGGGPSGGASGGGPEPGTGGFLQRLRRQRWSMKSVLKNLPVRVELASWAIFGFHAHQVTELARKNGCHGSMI